MLLMESTLSPLPAPAPPELAGGAGFTFEDSVAAYYLVSLLGELPVPGLPDFRSQRVAVQQAAQGEPLDDLIVNGVRQDGVEARLRLQVKRSLTIGYATDGDFRDIALRAWATLEKPNFREDIDRVGAATGSITESSRRALVEICEWARASESTATLVTRFNTEGVAGGERQRVFAALQTIFDDGGEATIRDTKVFRLLRHFVLITFDFLHEGAKDPLVAVERLQSSLAADTSNRAPELWIRLLSIARTAAGQAAEFDRHSLVRQLRGSYPLRAIQSLANDLMVLRNEAGSSISSIRNEISGFEISRRSTHDSIERVLANHRFVRLIGLPGTGKSAVLRSFAQEKVGSGNAFFLKSDRLQGSSWTGYAASLGVSSSPLNALLFEIGLTGTSIVFIDGIDRIETQYQGIIIDVVNAILKSPELVEWKVVVTARDNGIEPLRQWLPAEVLTGDGVGTVEVEGFNDSEAATLAKSFPALKTMLFGDTRVREIARRPFFASVLSRGARLQSAAAPKTEVELIEEWWRQGGYNANPQGVQKRQRALVHLAKMGAKTLGRRIRLDGVDLEALADLKIDDVLRDVRAGHSIQFSHDIFFEWSLLHFLIDQDERWIDAVRELGEPPALGRTVELLSQTTLPEGENWKQTLTRLETARLRSQFTRAWLLGPLSLPTFLDHSDTFKGAVLESPGNRLHHAATWFQAERTTANPHILGKSIVQDDLSPRDILRFADSLAWPSDVLTWFRFCEWLLDNIADVPIDVIPDVVSVFEVWQNQFADVQNDLSTRIVSVVVAWLHDIEDRQHPEQFSFDQGLWDVLGSAGIKELEERLRNLLLRAARTHELEVRQYLSRVQGKERLLHHAYQKITVWTRILAEQHAPDLVSLALAELCDELPESKAKKESRRHPYASDWDNHDWQKLSINEHHSGCFPSSPLREPFHSLFQVSHQHGLELVRRLTNHATTAWHQLFDIARKRDSRTDLPLPLILTFPWGVQEFWGGQRAYMWPRGHWATPPIVSGLMALQSWAFAERVNGRELDDILKDVVSEHESTAALNIAAALLLNENHVSATALPLVTSQALWHWDIHRLVNDGSGTNLLGFTKSTDRKHVAAIQALNAYPPRFSQLKSLATLFVLSGEEVLREESRRAILDFPNALPFQSEGEKLLPERISELRKTAELWAEMGRMENYSAKKMDDGSGILIEHQNPKAADPDIAAGLARGEKNNRQLALLNWVLGSFEKKSVGPALSPTEAIRQAKERDSAELYLRPRIKAYDDGMFDAMEQAVVAGVAAIATLYGGDLGTEEQAWCRDVLFRASRTEEEKDELWFSGSHLLEHPCLFAARGLAGVIKRDLNDQEAAESLLMLAGHPLEQISEEAIASAMSLWNLHPSLAWIALTLGTKLSIGSHNAPISAFGYDHSTEPERIDSAIDEAIDSLKTDAGREPLPNPPAPWVLAPPRRRTGFTEDDPLVPKAPQWRESDTFLRWDFLPKILKNVPVEDVLVDPVRGPLFRNYCYAILDWMLEHIHPSWRDGDRNGREGRALNLWNLRLVLMRLLARVALLTDPKETQAKVLDRIFALNDSASTTFIEPFADWLCAVGIIDAPAISERALALLQACVTHVLQNPDWGYARRRDGEIFGNELPELVRCFLFVTVEYAGGSARFANRDWREIGKVLPVVDPFVRAVGDIPYVASNFLTLCERAIEYYPVDAFVSQITQILENQPATPIGWRNSSIPARIAALVHSIAERTQPLPAELAQRMLRILDRLVDMGDRRSAALQISEIFKDIRV